MMKRRGFTLIELLVVIAIIAILAAILFPVFARARAKAKQITCLSNVKQIVLAALMYESDNDNMWWTQGALSNPTSPPDPSDVNNCNKWWSSTTGPYGFGYTTWLYAKNSQLYLDPLPGIADFAGNPCGNPTQVMPPRARMEYQVNATMLLDSKEPGINANYWSQNVGMPMSVVKYPAECFIICCMGARAGTTYPSQLYIGGPSQGPIACGGLGDVGTQHNGGANVGFMDGHAKWLSGTDPMWNGAQWPAASQSNYQALSHFWAGVDGPGWWF